MLDTPTIPYAYRTNDRFLGSRQYGCTTPGREEDHSWRSERTNIAQHSMLALLTRSRCHQEFFLTTERQRYRRWLARRSC